MRIQFFDDDGNARTGHVLRVSGINMIVQVTGVDGKGLAVNQTRLLGAHQACNIDDFWSLYKRLGGQGVSFSSADE